jgi:hypothetical protein
VEGVAGLLLSAAIAIVVAGCAAANRCPAKDLGGWITGDREPAYVVQHYCAPQSERFVLQAGAGGPALAELDVPLARGEATMFGFECGSHQNARGDVIAVVRHHRDGFEVKRAWTIDLQHSKFVAVPPQAIVCEAIE